MISGTRDNGCYYTITIYNLSPSVCFGCTSIILRILVKDQLRSLNIQIRQV